MEQSARTAQQSEEVAAQSGDVSEEQQSPSQAPDVLGPDFVGDCQLSGDFPTGFNRPCHRPSGKISLPNAWDAWKDPNIKSVGTSAGYRCPVSGCTGTPRSSSLRTIQKHWSTYHEKYRWRAPCFVPGCTEVHDWEDYISHLRHNHEHAQKNDGTPVPKNFSTEEKSALVRSHWWTWRLVGNPEYINPRNASIPDGAVPIVPERSEQFWRARLYGLKGEQRENAVNAIMDTPAFVHTAPEAESTSSATPALKKAGIAVQVTDTVTKKTETLKSSSAPQGPSPAHTRYRSQFKVPKGPVSKQPRGRSRRSAEPKPVPVGKTATRAAAKRAASRSADRFGAESESWDDDNEKPFDLREKLAPKVVKPATQPQAEETPVAGPAAPKPGTMVDGTYIPLPPPDTSRMTIGKARETLAAWHATDDARRRTLAEEEWRRFWDAECDRQLDLIQAEETTSSSQTADAPHQRKASKGKKKRRVDDASPLRVTFDP